MIQLGIAGGRIAQTAGEQFAVGVSSEDKGAPLAPKSFLAADTAQLFIADGVEWVPVGNHVHVKSLGDLPAPIAGVITLRNNTAYLINGTVDIGANRIVAGTRNIIAGVDRLNDIFISQTTGAFFTCSPGNLSLVFQDVTVRAPLGKLLDANAVGIAFLGCSITGTKELGTIVNPMSFTLRNTAVLNNTLSGFVFSGAGTAGIQVRGSTSTNNAAAMISFAPATTMLSVDINDNILTVNVGQTLFDATGLTVSVAGHVQGNIFSGAGSYVVGVDGETPKWIFANNTGVASTPAGFETAVVFAVEGIKTVTIANPRVKAVSKILGLSLRHTLGPTNWVIANVVSIAAGSVTVILIPQGVLGQSVRVQAITGTVTVGLILGQ